MAIVNALSLSETDVQDALNTANVGDTVMLPAGTSPIWTSGVEIPNNKKLKIEGQGIDTTIIVSDTANPTIQFHFTPSEVLTIGFDLRRNRSQAIEASGKDWRVHHNKFNSANSSYTIQGVRAFGLDQGHPTGLVDHCIFNDTRVLVIGDADLMANSIWAEPLGLGTNNAVFVEDCEFYATALQNAIDSNYGGRYVFRYNYLEDMYIEAHAVQGESRASRSWEIYGNVLHYGALGVWTPFFLRGGTGVVFNNTLTGGWTNPKILLNSRRSTQSFPVCLQCDGTSLWDGNEPSEGGYACRDQPGRSTDEWEWTTENPYPPQELDPVYAWNNKLNGVDVLMQEHNPGPIPHVVENRDYYNNTMKSGYTPYVYPHPLQGEEEMANIQEVVTGLDKIRDYVDSVRNRITTIKATTFPALDSQLTNSKILENKDIKRSIQQIQAWNAGTPTADQQKLIDDYDAILIWRDELRTGISGVQTALDTEDVF